MSGVGESKPRGFADGCFPMTLRILFIDKYGADREQLQYAFTEAGCTVLPTARTEEVFDTFVERRPDIILADIGSAGMLLIGQLRRIKRENAETEIIVIAGDMDFMSTAKCLEFDVADLLWKPIDGRALKQVIEKTKNRIAERKAFRERAESLECQLRNNRQKTQAAERLVAVGRMVATLSHSIKNIIGGLTGGMYVLEQGITLERREYLDRGWRMLKGNVEKIKSLTLDLLNYAKDREPEYTYCDPNDPAREVFELMVSRAQECHIRFRIDLDESLDGILFDPEGLHCCLLNLVANAFDACLAADCINKAHEVVIRTSRVEGWGVEYQISDNGCGMDEETRGRLFKVFFSTKGSRGTGLGLMISQKIVAEHAGTIDVKSEKGEGSTFIIRLPAEGRLPAEKSE